MSEKVRTLSLTSGNVLTSSTTSATNIGGGGGGMGGITLIGAPTLISSTFTPTPTQSLMTPSGCGGTGGGNSPTPNQHHHHSHHAHQLNLQGGSDTDSTSDFAPGAIIAQLNFHLLQDMSGSLSGATGTHQTAAGLSESNSIMNSSQISATSNDSIALSASPAAGGGNSSSGATLKPGSNGKHLTAQSVAGKTSCRFPKLEECAHFHYERVQLGPLAVRLVDDKSELLNSSIASQSIGGDIANTHSGSTSAVAVIGSVTGATGPSSFRSFSPSSCWFIIKVMPHRTDPFLVRRSFDNMQMLDEMLHRCVYDRKISGLRNLNELDFKSEEDVEYAVAKYLERFSKIASDSLTCGTILTWFQLDNKGRRLPLADGDTMRSINTPAVGAAYGVRRYTAQASDEISIEVGDMISVIDMPSPAESIWWRGKKSHLQKSHYEVGFFPQSCVATIGDKIPRHFKMPAPLVGQLDVSPTKPVLRKHGKLIAFFRSFILSRPSRRRLKQSGIYRERVFSCDLSEHLLNSGQEIPMVLKCCAEFLEDYGIVDGIYRLSGITSNIQRLRRAFDEERIPDLGNPEMKQDIHAVSSLLKMYFRELPNPLCTYQLYDNFVEAIQEKSESNERLRLMKETVLKLPPPHYRTLKYLATHLNKISQHSARTGMTDKNLAIVWAPNLLRSPALESGGVAALRGVGVQAVVTEYLIRNCHLIFDELDDCASNARLSYIATAGATPLIVTTDARLDSLTDCESLLVEQREHDQSLTFQAERPKSLSASGPKLISLEEAQERHSRLDGYDMNKSMPINMSGGNNGAANIGSYIEVGGGPSSLPDKYHTVLPVPRSWQKRKTHSWKSLFTRNQRASTGGSNELKTSLTPVDGASGNTPLHKEATQVTFAASDAIITNGGSGGGINVSGAKVPGKSLLKHQEKTKSTEHFDISRIDCSKPMEICVRSCSIDSLRTATGHSRSVSHDSYFDLLQSPQRGHMTTCPSRELSELGLNFDREEPEMRIFSESESLVSSPRVGKENIPPPSSAANSRRIMRARPEEFSSQTNSVNPSPKKQPRLNLLLSPTSAAAAATSAEILSSAQAQQNWPDANGGALCNEHVHVSSDESCCKRYKLEDQLNDIQFIDCSTPEHTNGGGGAASSSLTPTATPTSSMLYTSVQIHNPPKSLTLSKSSLYSRNGTESGTESISASNKSDVNETPTPTAASNKISSTFESLFGKAIDAANRYSYPTVQLGAKRKEQESNNVTLKERFSYPGSSRLPVSNETQKHAVEKQAINKCVTFSQQHSQLPQPTTLHHLPKPVPELLRPKNRYSYCDTSDATQHSRHSAVTQHQLNQLLMRSNSSELTKTPTARTRLSEVTPSSPLQSPRYSLLVGGDTSSENSSAVTTPQYDMEPLMMGSAMSGMSALSGTSSNMLQQQQPLLLAADSHSIGGGTASSRESLGNMLPIRDMHALKRELSLDLKMSNNCEVGGHKMSIDHADGTATLPAKLPLQQQLIPSPNNSNFTDNTSQSVTPSEFGYQHLQRNTSMHSLLETAENSPTTSYVHDYEQTPSHLASPLSSQPGQSPIRSTISITYNLKSPQHEAAPRLPKKMPLVAPPLETSFDEHTVYEQVKFFRNSVTAVNELVSVESGVGSTARGRGNLTRLSEEQTMEDSLLMQEQKQQISEVRRGKHKKDIYYHDEQLKEDEEQNDLIAEEKIREEQLHEERLREEQMRENLVRESNIRKEQTRQIKDWKEQIPKVQTREQQLRNEMIRGENTPKEPEQKQRLPKEQVREEEGKNKVKYYVDDVDMHQQQQHQAQVSLDSFCDNKTMLYENVELRKPSSIYENMSGAAMRGDELDDNTSEELADDVQQHDSLDSIQTNVSSKSEQLSATRSAGTTNNIDEHEQYIARRSPSNFSVKELANKFESCSPVEQLSAFDFSVRSSIKKHNEAVAAATAVATKPQHNLTTSTGNSNRELYESTPTPSPPPLIQQKLSRTQQQHQQQITRSLDENAFVREFGAKQLLHDMCAKSGTSPQRTQLDALTNRRKSYDFTRPKTLNPPKRLPGMPIAEELCLRSERNCNSVNECALAATHVELKITPTSENRISLIQNNVSATSVGNNVAASALSSSDLSNSNSNLASLPPSSLKALSGVKLDRERIDKIKQERRQQLTQKYRAESFKSRSKTDLHACEIAPEDDVRQHAESLRVKSKSRGDIRTLQKDLDSLKQFGHASVAGSETALHRHFDAATTISTTTPSQRVRSISDEKNQNCDVATNNTTTKASSANTTNAKTTNANANSSSDSSSASDDCSRRSLQRSVKSEATPITVSATEAEESSARATMQKFERKSLDFVNGGGTARERQRAADVIGNKSLSASRNSLSSTREKISPQFSIRDVTAMFESRAQNQQ